MGSGVVVEPNPRRHQFAINVSTNIAVMMLNILVGLWFTPYLIAGLGVASYGIVILAVSLTSYLSIANNAIDNAIGRFLTIDLNKKQFAVADKTFNTAFWPSLFLICLLIPVVIAISYWSPQFFSIPAGEEDTTRWLFAFVLSSYLFIIIRSSFTASAFAHNRLDLKNLVFSSSVILRVVLVIALFTMMSKPAIWHVGLATMLGAVASVGLAIHIWRRLTPFLTIRWQSFDHERLRIMFSMSGWLIINQVGTLLFLNIDLIVVNMFLGVETQGRYGSVLQWVVLLRTLGDTMATALTPIVLSQYARQQMDRLAQTTRQAVGLLGMLMALPIGLVAGLSGPILLVWLGSDFVDLAVLLSVMTVHLCINVAIRPLFSLQVVFNQVKWPGLVTILLGILNVALAISWVHWGHNGLGVALAGALVLTLKNSLFTPLYGAYIQKLPWYTFLIDLLPGIGGTLLVITLSIGLNSYFTIDSWLDLIFSGLVIGGIYSSLLGLYLWRNAEWRTLILSLLKR